MIKYPSLVLCGFMACGKTTVSKIVSKKTGLNFIDMDDLVEKQEGMSIKSIFSVFGEDYFRNLEKIIAEKIALVPDVVVSSGGGAVINPEIISSFKNANMKIVFLDASFDVICSRLEGTDSRPLVNDTKTEDLYKLFTARYNIYKTVSDFVVNADDEPYNVCNEILKFFK